MVTTSVKPADFVDELTAPGLPIQSGEFAPLRQYLCSNPSYGGAEAAGHLFQTLLGIARRRGVDLRARCDNDPFVGRVFTGQGRPSSVQAIMNFMLDHQADLEDVTVGRTNRQHPKKYGWYFEQAAPFATMVEDKLFGFDCIGFVSRYLCRAGYFTDYRQWPPLAYLNTFHPIGASDEAGDLSILVWENGSHIAIIDTVEGVSEDRHHDLTATLCQSSSSHEARGPQTNVGVVLRPTGRRGSYRMFGQSGSGMIFRIIARGHPIAPVAGHVYIGKARDLSYQHERSRESHAIALV